MIASATVTAKVGPAQTVTAQVIPNVTYYEVDVSRAILRIWQNGVPGQAFSGQGGKTLEFDINAITTFTTTVVAGTSLTLTIS